MLSVCQICGLLSPPLVFFYPLMWGICGRRKYSFCWHEKDLSTLDAILFDTGKQQGKPQNSPIDIATCSQSVQQDLVDSLNGSLQVSLDDTVELECCFSGDLERPIAMFIGNSVHL
jgi:hypothetical protein